MRWPARSRFLRPRRVLAGLAALLLLAYGLAGFFLVPRVARTQAEAFVTETLQRKIAIGEIGFNPFTFAVEITDLRLTEADGSPLVSFQYLLVNAEVAASLWRRGVVLKELEIVAPDIELVVAPDGSVNLAQLAPPAGPPPDQPPADAPPLRVHIGKFSVTDGRVGFQDRSRAEPFSTAFSPIRFSLTDFRTDVGHSNAYSFTTAARVAARFEWSGAFTVQPLGSTGTFSARDVRLKAVDEYLKGQLPVEIASGTVQLEGSYKFDLQPLALEVALPSIAVRDLVLAERGAATSPPVAIPHIDVHDVALSLTRRDVGVRRVEVRGTSIDVVREADGGINLLRLAPPPGAAAAPPQRQEPAAKPWTVHAGAIAVEEATVRVEDRSLSPPARFLLAPIAIGVNGFSTAPGARIKLDTQVGIERVGRLAVKGEVGLQPLAAALAIDLQRFPLPALQPYVTQLTSTTLHSGRLDVKARVNFTPRGSRVSADVKVEDLRASDNVVKEDLLKWRSLAITGIQFQQRPDRLRIERIVATEPYARVIIAQNGSINLVNALTPPPGREPKPAPEPAPEKKPAGPPLPVEIRAVQIVEGSANFADYSIEPSVATGIIGLNGQVEGLSSAPESRAKVAIKGRVDEFSPVEVSGEINLLSAAVYSDVALSLRNIELTTFNPYSGKFAGYSISKGKLSTTMKYRVENRKLDAQHHIVIDNLEFGAATDSKDAAPIPIKLGVALLKDKRGVITIDLPIGGTLDDPQFSVGSIIWNGIINLLARAIAAPFAALGAMFSDEQDLAFVDFQPGSAALGAAESKRLGTLARGLVERPELRLNVPLTLAPAADSEATAQQALRALVPPADPAKPQDEGARKKRVEVLQGAYLAQLKTAPATAAEGQSLDSQIADLQAALLAHLKPTPAALDALAQQRATAVRAVLLANKELAPERIFIVSKPGEVASAEGRVRMEMKLE